MGTLCHNQFQRCGCSLASDICVVVDHKFDRDMYQNYMRELLAIKQTTTIVC